MSMKIKVVAVLIVIIDAHNYLAKRLIDADWVVWLVFDRTTFLRLRLIGVLLIGEVEADLKSVALLIIFKRSGSELSSDWDRIRQ
jgi:hypothetical protein